MIRTRSELAALPEVPVGEGVCKRCGEPSGERKLCESCRVILWGIREMRRVAGLVSLSGATFSGRTLDGVEHRGGAA